LGFIVVALGWLVLLSGCVSTPSPATQSPATPGRTPVAPYLQTSEEFWLGVVACLQDKGYDPHLDAEGGISFDGVMDQKALQADSRACQESMDPARLLPPPPLTASQLQEMYGYLIAQVRCMRDAGYPVSEPPPFQVYVDTNMAFDPYGDLRQRGLNFSHADLLRCQHVPERPDFLDY
jgi:hypothetical protein